MCAWGSRALEMTGCSSITRHRCAGLLEQAEEPALSPACVSYWNDRRGEAREVAASAGQAGTRLLLPAPVGTLFSGAVVGSVVGSVVGLSECRIIIFAARPFCLVGLVSNLS